MQQSPMQVLLSLVLAMSINTTPLTDQTNLLQQLLNKSAGKTITLPTGLFMIRTLTVPKETHLIIGQKTIIKGLPTDQPMPILNLSASVQVTGSGLIDGNRSQRKKGMGVRIFDAQGVTINGLRIREVAEQGVQMAGCKSIVLTNLHISGCGVKGVDQYQGINLVTSQNVQITGCQINNVQHGIQWWGDDTNGWCENILIKGNQIRRVAGGGIWGNKGRNITVMNNTTEICGDVGVDFEHSANCSATGNTIRDCKNYGLAIFYSSERIMFTNNTVYQGLNYGHGIGLVGNGISKQISFIGGSINTKGLNSCGLITIGTNVATDVLVKGIRVVTEGKGGIPIRVVDNNGFKIISNPLISGFGAAGVSLEGSSQSVVEDNVITHRGPDESKMGERGGIFIYFRTAEYPAQNNSVRRNTIRGYQTGINDECWGNVNSNNIFVQNVTPNLVHRVSNGVWGGKMLQNRTEAKSESPIQIKQ